MFLITCLLVALCIHLYIDRGHYMEEWRNELDRHLSARNRLDAANHKIKMLTADVTMYRAMQRKRDEHGRYIKR